MVLVVDNLCEGGKPTSLADLEAISIYWKKTLIIHTKDHTRGKHRVFWLEGVCRWISRQMIRCWRLYSLLPKKVFQCKAGWREGFCTCMVESWAVKPGKSSYRTGNCGIVRSTACLTMYVILSLNLCCTSEVCHQQFHPMGLQ